MGNYDDIINLPHHRSQTHPHMSVGDRAAQFAPFAALTGYDDAIDEEGRLTSDKIELDENSLSALDITLSELSARIASHPRISVTYFLPDEKKAGGAYLVREGALKKIDSYNMQLIFCDGFAVDINNILSLELLD